MTHIILKGEPISTNNVYKTVCRGNFPTRYMSARGKSLKEGYQWDVKQAWKGEPTQGKVLISMQIFFGTRRKQDIDNYSKIVLDSLTGIVYEDDSQIYVLYIAKFYDKENPRVELEINVQ